MLQGFSIAAIAVLLFIGYKIWDDSRIKTKELSPGAEKAKALLTQISVILASIVSLNLFGQIPFVDKLVSSLGFVVDSFDNAYDLGVQIIAVVISFYKIWKPAVEVELKAKGL